MPSDMKNKAQTGPLTLFWFRRDLRLEDNAGLYQALSQSQRVQCLFIFDETILSHLAPADKRVPFLHLQLSQLQETLRKLGSELWVLHGNPEKIFEKLFTENSVAKLVCNRDYEPQALRRDENVQRLCKQNKIEFLSFKDQVIFEKTEVLTDSAKPYTVYTPYKKKWLSQLGSEHLESFPTENYFRNLQTSTKLQAMPKLSDLGFEEVSEDFYPDIEISQKLLKDYAKLRDFPALKATSLLGLHLRFGTVSVRELAREGQKYSDVWLSELIWREFFMQILFHFPHVVNESFRPQYEKVKWRDSEADFQKWCTGQTGYPLVDAGMRELNATGFMHNRVRMMTASFLTKHLLMHWLKGERYFAAHLLDFDLSANNGNWQWAAGTGCDAAPYFRIFNPTTQLEKFDPDLKYVKKWVPEYGTSRYPKPMIDHVEARERCLKAFSLALKGI